MDLLNTQGNEFQEGFVLQNILNFLLDPTDSASNFFYEDLDSFSQFNPVAVSVSSTTPVSNSSNLMESDTAQLYQALAKKDDQKIELLLSQIKPKELDFTELDSEDNFILLKALKISDPKYFLPIIAKLDLLAEEQDTGCTVLILAIKEGLSIEFIKALLTYGPTIDKEFSQDALLAFSCHQNRNALAYAAICNYTEAFLFIFDTLQILRREQPKFIESILTITDENEADILKLAVLYHSNLFKRNADLTIIQTLLSIKDEEHSSLFKPDDLLLHGLQNKACLTVLQKFREWGAKVNVQDKAGLTPLLYAGLNNRSDSIKNYLMSQGADPEIKELIYDQNFIQVAEKARDPSSKIQQLTLYREALAKLEELDQDENSPLAIQPIQTAPSSGLEDLIKRTLTSTIIKKATQSQFSMLGGESSCAVITAEMLTTLLEDDQEINLDRLIEKGVSRYQDIIYYLNKTNFLNVQQYTIGTHLTWLQDIHLAYPHLINLRTETVILRKSSLFTQMEKLFEKFTKEDRDVGISLLAQGFFFTLAFKKQGAKLSLHFFDSHGIAYFDLKAYHLIFDDFHKASDFVSLRLSMLMHSNEMETKFDMTALNRNPLNLSPIQATPSEQWARLLLTRFLDYSDTEENKKTFFFEKILPYFKTKAVLHYTQLTHPLFLLLHYLKTQKEPDVKEISKVVAYFFTIYPYKIDNFDLEDQTRSISQLEMLLLQEEKGLNPFKLTDQEQAEKFGLFLFFLSKKQRANLIEQYRSLYLFKELHRAKLECINQEIERLQNCIKKDQALYSDSKEKTFLKMERFNEIIALYNLITQIKDTQDLNLQISAVLHLILDLACSTRDFLLNFKTATLLQQRDLKTALEKMDPLFTILFSNKQLCYMFNLELISKLVEDYKAIIQSITLMHV